MRTVFPILFIVMLALAAALPLAAADVHQQIEDLLATQSAAWNRGDLEAFTAVYADDAVFVSPSGLTRGRQEVLDRYRRRYPDHAAMGRLELEVVELRPVPGARRGRISGASAVARWRLAYPEDAERDDAEGLTLLVFHRRGGEWKIVQDASM